MKKSIIFVFLLMMSFLVTSSYSVAILTEPNMTKDFTLSTDYATSNQSITSIGETIADNLLLYPDGLLTDEFFATGGDTGYGNTYAVDASYFTVVVDNELEFDDIFEGLGVYPGDAITGYFTYSIYGVIFLAGDHSNVEYSRDGVSWSAPFDDIDSTGYHTGTVSIDLQYTETFYINFESSTQIDYMHLQFFVDPVPDANVFVETFADVSDWTFDVASGTYSFTSDGDIGNMTAECVSTGNDYVRYEQYSLTIPKESYVEFRYRTIDARLRIQFFDGDMQEPVPCYEIYSTAYSTVKFYLGAYVDNDVTGIEIQINDLSNTKDSGNIYTYIDYLRIGPSDLMGWQHDGSTTVGITAESGGTVSTDGDNTTLNSDGTTYFYIPFDNTTTGAELSLGYYPFLRIDIISGSGRWALAQYDGSGYASLQSTTTISIGEKTYNMESVDSRVEHWRLLVMDAGELVFDYIKAYSIANFSYVAGGGESINDYSYVDDGKLIVHTDTYTKWNFDPTLSVTIATYDIWNITIQGDDSGFRFRELLDTNTLWDQGIITGYLVGTTLEDFDILIYSDCNITAISFLYQLPEWNEIIDDAELLIEVALDLTGFNMLLIFFGICLVPTSTIFLVYGGKKNLSMDKMFYFLIMFIIGWALIIGGIM